VNTTYFNNSLENTAMQMSLNIRYAKHITSHCRYFLWLSRRGSQNALDISVLLSGGKGGIAMLPGAE